jgi:hypothetical protein
MHDHILSVERAIVSLNNASISINDYMTHITNKLNSADIPPIEIKEDTFQKGGPLNFVIDDLNDLKRSVSDHNVFLYKLEALLRETHTK